MVLQTDVEGRHIDEIDFSNALMIGQFRAVDYFGDGSLYVLDVPGVSERFASFLDPYCGITFSMPNLHHPSFYRSLLASSVKSILTHFPRM